MRIARIVTTQGPDFAIQGGDASWVPIGSLGIEARSTAEVIARHAEIPTVEELGGGMTDLRLLAPVVAPAKIIAIGLNYLDHIRETGSTAPAQPIAFAKFPTSLNDPEGDIVIDPDLTRQGDYEVELAVVLGRTARRVKLEEALEMVFGYTVANDVSARDAQRADGQLTRSKSFDTFCPIGPWITTADEIPEPQDLPLRTKVNGEVRQDSSTREMLFPVTYLIHYLSRGMTLEPGDVILTGTPHGVGFAMNPPRFLAQGDLVECEVEGLGRLRNRVVAPDGQ